MTIKFKGKEDMTINSAREIYLIMRVILMRENKIDRDREHLWTISLNNDNKILNIELVSFGSVNQTIVEPMEVFSVPLQRRAVSIILVHNHPSGKLVPSLKDKDVTDRLIQCGIMMHVNVLDHVIITEKGYYSFEESGVLNELLNNSKYEIDFNLKGKLLAKVAESKKEGELQKAKEMARVMKAEGMEIEKIMKFTGLSKAVINKIKYEI